MTKKWVELNNGIKYDPESGETLIQGDDPNNPSYWYNPNAFGGAKTFINGQSYAGRYDPYTVNSITGDDLTKATAKHEGYLDSIIGNLEKNAFIQTEKGATDAIKTPANIYSNLSFSSAYDEARKKNEGTFFDEVKQLDFTQQKDPYITDNQRQQIENNASLSPAVKQAILGGYEEWQNKPSSPTQPTAPSQAMVPTSPSEPAAQQSPEQLDWKALYDQISGYFTQPQQNALGTKQPREQIGSFQQFGPTIARRQQSYVSSTPYGSKGS